VTAECFARLSYSLGVCQSVCSSLFLSVTLLYRIKTVQARVMKFSLRAALRTLVFVTKLSATG